MGEVKNYQNRGVFMSRPPKCRRVEFIPEMTYFKPAGVPMKDLAEVILSVEELEAIRLKDLMGFEQEECAVNMGVSRPTYHRILSAARAKVADALVNGKAIRVEGGNFQVAVRRYRCTGCGSEWEAPCERRSAFREITCPSCDSTDIRRINQDGTMFNCTRWKEGLEQVKL
jgi:predicted DNA-binding protein (UPF0251 family)